jgi:hypothetical protein
MVNLVFTVSIEIQSIQRASNIGARCDGKWLRRRRGRICDIRCVVSHVTNSSRLQTLLLVGSKFFFCWSRLYIFTYFLTLKRSALDNISGRGSRLINILRFLSQGTSLTAGQLLPIFQKSAHCPDGDCNTYDCDERYRNDEPGRKLRTILASINPSALALTLRITNSSAQANVSILSVICARAFQVARTSPVFGITITRAIGETGAVSVTGITRATFALKTTIE